MFVVLRGADILVPVSALSAAGLRQFNGAREQIGADEVVSLVSLAPAVSFTVDDRELKLRLTADPSLLGEDIRNLYSGAPIDLVYKADTSGFLNYAINYSNDGQSDGFAESALSMRGVSLYNTIAATPQAITRGVTSMTIDQRTHLRRWIVGDSFSYSGALGGDAWLAGLSVAKEFAIDPYFVRHPTLSLTTPISVPSVMEVHVNGQVVSREQIDPGRLELRNLPMTLGRNDAQIIVRDAFGGERELSSTYYLTTRALAKGLHEYQYSVGVKREALGTESWEYSTLVGLARHRVGLSDTVTAGGRLEIQSGLYSAGPSMNVRLPVGEIEAAVGVSRQDGGWGRASLLGFNFTGRPMNVGGSLLLASREYRTLSPSPADEDPEIQGSAFASTALGRLSITLQHASTRFHQGTSRSRFALLSTLHIAKNLDLTASVSRTRDERGRGREVYAGVTTLFGATTASVAHIRDARGNRLAADAQRSLPVGEGYGYQLHTESGDTRLTNGAVRYQGRHGRYELRQESIAGRTTTTLSTMGSLVAIGGGLHASRPVQDSFALIRVPGVEGVHAFASHQVVGKTSRNGDLLVPDLQAYYGNILGVADGDIPLTHSIAEVGQTLALPYRGGAVALFRAERIQRVVGMLRIGGGGVERVPAHGDVTVDVEGRILISPIGGTGAFYFESLPPGRHDATIRERSGEECSFTIVVPSSEIAEVDLGTLRCEAVLP